jgi:hypothetical protein
MNNSNKTISVNSKGIVISYTDSNKHMFVKFQNQDFPKRKLLEKVQEIETPVFNEKQQRMYSEALYGTTIYTEAFVNKMPKRVLVKIITRCEAVQKVINRWKQEIVNHKVDCLLTGLFPKSPIVKQMVGIEADDTVKCYLSLKDLGLDQVKVAQKLVSLNLLPENFFDLK